MTVSATQGRLGRGPAAVRALGLCVHVLAASALGYFASSQWVELSSQVLHSAGMARADAVIASVMLGFIYLLVTLVWAFSRTRLVDTWIFLLLVTGAGLLGKAAMGAIT